MATPKTETPTEHDARIAREMIMWARKNRVSIHQLTIGSLAMVLTDEGMPAPAGAKPGSSSPARPEPANAFEEFGGDAWKKAQEDAGRDPDDDLDDEDDADEQAEAAAPARRR